MNRRWRIAAICAFAVARAPMDAAAQSPPPLPLSSLPLTVTGVVVDTTERTRSVSLIRCANSGAGRASVYAIGDRACDVAEVVDIRDDSIVVRDAATGRLEQVPLAPGGGSARPGPDIIGHAPVPGPMPAAPPIVSAPAPDLITVVVTREALERYWADLPSLLTSVQATPHYQISSSGQRTMDGFTLGSTTPGSVLGQLGLQPGDVILDVNGDPLDNPAAAMRLLALARDLTQARVRINRQGRPMTIAVTVK